MRELVHELTLTRDTILSGRLILDQPARGHRVGTDTMLVIAAARAFSAERIVEFGAGTGAIGLALLQERPGSRAILIERDAEMAALCASNAALNALSDRVDVRAADVVQEMFDVTADLVVANPPFHPATGRASHDEKRARARHESDDFAGWVAAAGRVLVSEGSFVFIHRADALAGVLAALTPCFGAIVIRPVHPQAHKAATRIIVSARRGRRTPLTLSAPLVLHERDGSFTPETATMHA